MNPYDVPGFDFDLTKDDYDLLVWAAELEENGADDGEVYWAVADSHSRRVALRRCVKFGLMEECGTRIPVYCDRYPDCHGARGRCLNTSCDTMRRGFRLTSLGLDWVAALDDKIRAEEQPETHG